MAKKKAVKKTVKKKGLHPVVKPDLVSVNQAVKKTGKKIKGAKMPKIKTTKLHTLKEAMIQALESTLGIVTTAAKKIGIDRTTHYLWMQDDLYRERVEAIADIALDFVESKLHGQIAKGDTTASIFYLKTKGKNRGYIERTEIDHSIKKDTDIPIFEWASTPKKIDEAK